MTCSRRLRSHQHRSRLDQCHPHSHLRPECRMVAKPRQSEARGLVSSGGGVGAACAAVGVLGPPAPPHRAPHTTPRPRRAYVTVLMRSYLEKHSKNRRGMGFRISCHPHGPASLPLW
jgi:hypothetical protein